MKVKTESDYRILPNDLLSKRAILNHRNNNQWTFVYGVLFALYPIDWKIYTLKSQTNHHHPDQGLDKIKYNVLIDEFP